MDNNEGEVLRLHRAANGFMLYYEEFRAETDLDEDGQVVAVQRRHDVTRLYQDPENRKELFEQIAALVDRGACPPPEHRIRRRRNP